MAHFDVGLSLHCWLVRTRPPPNHPHLNSQLFVQISISASEWDWWATHLPGFAIEVVGVMTCFPPSQIIALMFEVLCPENCGVGGVCGVHAVCLFASFLALALCNVPIWKVFDGIVMMMILLVYLNKTLSAFSGPCCCSSAICRCWDQSTHHSLDLGKGGWGPVKKGG